MQNPIRHWNCYIIDTISTSQLLCRRYIGMLSSKLPRRTNALSASRGRIPLPRRNVTVSDVHVKVNFGYIDDCRRRHPANLGIIYERRTSMVSRTTPVCFSLPFVFSGAFASAQEVVDYTTARQGMHACPVGLYMTGIHVGNNIFLCNQIGRGYQISEEIVDTSTVDFGMHACPSGKVMTGFHESENRLLCAPTPETMASARILDQPPGQTVRQNMHACPINLPMSGIHVGNNTL